ncbi:MAG: DUF979 domain-containing protein [Oscillospiraceae bacterium]|nr:DUF979 domain-containing protein [Oscillospiraceae bacterium]MBR4928362.1 DUF979 domain-containing protein [Oscillospiraceae bacterium]MBR5045112.1 DUF979 domain-containing protein [Oscillospiraceae bacterium]MBR5071703.1 DUF979 domain-containing protein [Oscillospiraceae bacterium]MBR5979419.1 DUF979 domain-containing protein [Oscillospiraceae bacterium]
MTFSQILSEVFFTLIGIVFALVGLKAVKDPGAQKKATTAAFWFVLAFTFIFGNWVPKWIIGLCVVVLAVLSGIKGVVQSASDVPDPTSVREQADKFGYKIFIPALVLALSSVVFATLGSKVPALSWMTSNNAICLGGLCALITVLCMTKADPKYIVADGTRLMDNVGVTGILPQVLSALGTLFTAAGVGTVISKGVSAIIPEGNKLIACAVYCIAMALFTIIMGNGFAAFSVITVGIGIPFLISQGANPIVVGALGLTAGYCGTLCTPMAANFNIMPAALLEVKNKYAIIKSQVPVALCMLVIHIILMYLFAF